MVNLSPKLRFPEFSGNWKSKKLEEVGSVINGLTYSPDDIHDDGVLVLRSSNIKENQLSFNDNVYVNTDNYNPVRENDILICVRNGSRNLIGKNAIITKDAEGVAFGAFMSVYRSELNKFVFQLFATDTYYKIIQENLGATINSINNSDLKKFEFYFPLKEEQDKIAVFLSNVDNKINQVTKKKEQLELYKKGVMQKIFNQELRFNDNENKIFPNWEIVKLSSICEYKNGGSFENYVCKDGIYNLISLNSIDINGKIKKEHKKVSISDNSLKKGDLIMVLSDVAHGNFLGLTDIVPGDNFVLNQRMGALKPIKVVNTFYLKTFINFNQKYFKKKGQGSSQLNLSKGDVLNFSIKLPCIYEQNKIANFLSAIEDKIEQVNFQLENTIYFKKALLQEMFI